MNGVNEQKELIKKDIQELEAKNLLYNLKEEQKALKILETPISFSKGFLSSQWGNSIWMLLFVFAGVYFIFHASNNREIASGVLIIAVGIVTGIQGRFMGRMEAIRYLILKMRKEISELKAKK